MLDHIGLSVTDYVRSKAFYTGALAPLGYAPIFEVPKEGTDQPAACGFGIAPTPDFWIAGGGKTSPGIHVCFRAETRAAVDAFYKAALAAGGSDNGAPGLRPQYHANYYGAFVRDFDGHNVEAVCHTPQ
jgi:catechol 2,3-dioxygenase-like lactoylglutathione lyase family enzyme